MKVPVPDSGSRMATGRLPSQLVGPDSEPGPADVRAEELAKEMAAVWQRGERPGAEEFLVRHPELSDDPGAALRVIYEEICLREESGQEVAPEELLRRFPQWREELEAFFECRRLIRPAFAEVAEVLRDFRLLAELGRGGAGRVFLATQPALADRPVVLKVTSCAGREHLSLARLQHTHIVPLFWMQDFPARNLRALCMPYLGGATLERVLAALRDQPPGQRTGYHLLLGLDQSQAAVPVELPRQGPTRRFLAQASYAQAVCWIGACLADALHYAHERGLVHLDLKPSNILLAADGQPLVLDFHLARGSVRADESAPEWFGGTPDYLSPEQQAALAAVHQRRPLPGSVDSRSDIYSLGLVLYEMLAGPVPVGPPAGGLSKLQVPVRTSAQTVFAPGPVSPRPHWLFRPIPQLPRLDGLNSQVSTGLADIIHKCLAHDPCDRYPDAAALAADLQRHRTNRPLQGVANRSLVERWRKWRRRRPYALALGAMFLTVLTTALLAAAMTLADRGRRSRGAEVEAREALAASQEQIKKQQYAEAVHTLTRGRAAAEVLPAGGELAQALDQRLRLARRAEAAHRLHLVADRLRFLYGIDSLPAGQGRALEAHCRAAWEARGWITESADTPLELEAEQRIRTDLLDLATLRADLCVRLAPAEEAVRARREALRMFAEAEAVFGPSSVLCRERQAHSEALGLTDEAQAAARRASAQVPRTAWEYYALGRVYLRSANAVSPAAAAAAAGLAGSPTGAGPWLAASALAARGAEPLARAAGAFERALDLQPQDFWANFYQGLCAYRLGRHANAARAFHVCVALAPQSAECFYNRALAHAALGQTDQALRDYERALQLAPYLAAAALNRGMLHYQQRRYAEAEADLQRALDGGADPAMVCYNLALVQLAQENWAAARQSLVRTLQHNPEHQPARDLYGSLQRQQ